MTEWIAIIFFCLPGSECRFWASSASFSSQARCEVQVMQVATQMKQSGADTAPACIKMPKEKAFDADS